MIKSYVNKSINQSSPVQEDFERVVKYDESGKEYITFLPVDYPKLQKSLGNVSDWQLSKLLKAGINPNFSIHTGNNTRLEGHDTVMKFSSELDSILENNNN